MISLEQVTVQRQGVIALDQVTHTIHPGQSVAVIGPTGSGKTTLLETIAGLLPIQSGNAIFCGVLITDGLTAHSTTHWLRAQRQHNMADDTSRRMPRVIRNELWAPWQTNG